VLVTVCFTVTAYQPITPKSTTPKPRPTARVPVVPGALVKVPSDNIYIFIVRVTGKDPNTGNVSRKYSCIPTDSVPTDAIPTIHSQDDQVNL